MTETKNDIASKNVSSKGDNILKWYTIFALFLFINLCGVGYAYYYKFYRNKDISTATESLSSQAIKDIPDTVYVDNANDENEADASDNNDENNQVAEVVLVPHVERARQLSFSVSATEEKTNNTITDDASTSISKKSAGATATSKNINATNGNKSSLPLSTVRSEEESHTFMITLGMFKDNENAMNLIHELKLKGVEGELINSKHFEKLPPSFVLVLAGKELSSASAYQMCAVLKKKGVDCNVQDGGKYSWR